MFIMVDVAFMVGHDDDVVLDPTTDRRRSSRSARTSRFTGLQSDLAIVECIQQSFPHLSISTLRTVEELLATEAKVVVVISYLTQPSYSWYSSFFEALHTLEARGVTVYPRADFKEHISAKACYMRTLQSVPVVVCPTRVLDRANCVDASGELQPALLDAQLCQALTELRMLRVPDAPPHGLRLVTKPSNADGGFGVAFWEVPRVTPPAGEVDSAAPAPATEPAQASVDENVDAQHATVAGAPACGAGDDLHLVSRLQCGAMLTCGCDLPAVTAAAASSGNDGAEHGQAQHGGKESAFFRYVRDVAFASARPHLLLQPLVPQLAHNFEIKIYFLRRTLFYAALTYGKERLLAKVPQPRRPEFAPSHVHLPSPPIR